MPEKLRNINSTPRVDLRWHVVSLGRTQRAHLFRYGRDLEERAAELAIEAAACGPAVTLTVGIEGPPATPGLPSNDVFDPEEKLKI
jgi:hypothetical protein